MYFSLWTLVPLANAAAAAFTMQVNYFKDGGCSDYLTSVHPFTNGNCYDYQYGGTNSAGITNCDGLPKGYKCYCTLYTGGHCTGASQTVAIHNCASNYGHGFESMQCFALPG